MKFKNKAEKFFYQSWINNVRNNLENKKRMNHLKINMKILILVYFIMFYFSPILSIFFPVSILKF
jgi:hypothetical protein